MYGADTGWPSTALMVELKNNATHPVTPAFQAHRALARILDFINPPALKLNFTPPPLSNQLNAKTPGDQAKGFLSPLLSTEVKYE